MKNDYLNTSTNTPDEIFQALKVSPTIDGKFIVLEDFKINGITIEKGYKTNGANIPKMFWSFIPPFKVQNLPAVVVHDYLCDKEKYTEADRQFKTLLNHFRLEKYRYIMIKVVKIYHKIKYKAS